LVNLASQELKLVPDCRLVATPVQPLVELTQLV